MASQIVNIGGITIHFPHEPYEVQKKYMEKMIECLQGGVNGILESPTGTGKTLSLLCASLAWLEDRKAALQLYTGVNPSSDPGASDIFSKLNALGSAAGTGCIYPKIIYSSRTHSQLSQAIGELKKTSYKYVKSVVLGSRDQLCIHPDVQKLHDSASKLSLCRQKVNTKTCPFHLNYETKMMRAEYQENPVMDIEDLGRLGKKFTCCPYYTSRSLRGKADIIFMPYNYLVDPKLRKSHGVDLDGNIVIFDEAHNIENMCEDSMSFTLLSSDLALCIKETSHVADLMQQKSSDTSSLGEGTEPDFMLLDIAKVKAILFAMENCIDEIVAQASGDSIIKPGNFMFDAFKAAGVNKENKDDLLDLLDKMESFLEANAVGAFSPRGTGLNRIASILKSLHAVEGDNLPVESIFNLKYKVHIQKDANAKKGAQDIWTVPKAAGKKSNWTLNCWCFSPSVSMANLMRQGVRSIILTSGTLAPLSSFASELGIPFPVQLESPHVISDSQVYVSVLNSGCDGQALDCTYQNRNNKEYLASLGRTICNFCRVIPGGVLLFFPSYSVMRTFMEFWSSNGTMSSLNLVKHVVTEMQRGTDFSSLIQEYYENVDSPEKKGCVLLAVCRGRMSEGMDFADQYARAAIVVGFPLPPCFDPRVQLKKQYLNDTASKTSFSGNDWYLLQATRAVNQAIGRVIRHKHDFGAILFCDRRYSEQRNLSQLSKWVRERTKVNSGFGTVLRDLTQFFRAAGAITSGPAPALRSKTHYTNAFGINSESSPGPCTGPRLSTGCSQPSASEDIAESIMQGYMKPKEGSGTSYVKTPAHSVHNLFDKLDSLATPPAEDFCSFRKINFRTEVDRENRYEETQNPKRRKLTVPLKGLEPIQAPCTSHASSSSANRASPKDVWKATLALLKKSLTNNDYNVLCGAMKKYLQTQDSDSLAGSLGVCLLNIPDRESLLLQLASVVTSSAREDFLVKCRSHW